MTASSPASSAGRSSISAVAQPEAASSTARSQTGVPSRVALTSSVPGVFQQVLPQASSSRTRNGNAAPRLTMRDAAISIASGRPGTTSMQRSGATAAKREVPSGSQ